MCKIYLICLIVKKECNCNICIKITKYDSYDENESFDLMRFINDFTLNFSNISINYTCENIECDVCKKTITDNNNDEIFCLRCDKTLCVDCQYIKNAGFIKCDNCKSVWCISCTFNKNLVDYGCEKCTSHESCFD